MSRWLDVHQRPERELVFRCHCGGDHFLTFNGELLDGEWDVGVIADYRADGTWWGRARTAWFILRGGCPWSAPSVGLNRDDVGELALWCESLLDDTKPVAFPDGTSREYNEDAHHDPAVEGPQK